MAIAVEFPRCPFAPSSSSSFYLSLFPAVVATTFPSTVVAVPSPPAAAAATAASQTKSALSAVRRSNSVRNTVKTVECEYPTSVE